MITALRIALITASTKRAAPLIYPAAPLIYPVWRLAVANMADDTQASADQQPKTAKQLKREEEKNAKLTKFLAKKEAAEKKNATEVRVTLVPGYARWWTASSRCR